MDICSKILTLLLLNEKDQDIYNYIKQTGAKWEALFLTCNHVTKTDDVISIRHVGGILISNMASLNNVLSRAPVFSEYYNSLSGPEKVRYKDKTDVCGCDPYSLKKF